MWQYCMPKSSLVPFSTTPSSSESAYKYFWNKLTLHVCRFAFNTSPSPGWITLTVVVFWSYPIPDSKTLISVKVPLLNTGVITAPVPSPLITRSGGEIYCLPGFNTRTSSILPWLIIAWHCASCPGTAMTKGGLSKFRTSEAPYPTPLFDKLTDVICPLKIGCNCAWKVSKPIEDIPICPEIETDISG